jgi:hypothetical protein
MPWSTVKQMMHNNPPTQMLIKQRICNMMIRDDLTSRNPAEIISGANATHNRTTSRNHDNFSNSSMNARAITTTHSRGCVQNNNHVDYATTSPPNVVKLFQASHPWEPVPHEILTTSWNVHVQMSGDVPRLPESSWDPRDGDHLTWYHCLETVIQRQCLRFWHDPHDTLLQPPI